MPSQAYALKEGGPKRLQISWEGFWKNAIVQLDDEIIGTLATRKQLSAGHEFLLPDGSSLNLQLVRTLTAYELHVLRDGQPLPGSASAPESRVRSNRRTPRLALDQRPSTRESLWPALPLSPTPLRSTERQASRGQSPQRLSRS